VRTGGVDTVAARAAPRPLTTSMDQVRTCRLADTGCRSTSGGHPGAAVALQCLSVLPTVRVRGADAPPVRAGILIDRFLYPLEGEPPVGRTNGWAECSALDDLGSRWPAATREPPRRHIASRGVRTGRT